ncbi:hypothetical protein [Longimicrobium terrae]|uniref:Uncharacterized protein n=1 Tax=Longimicrobium terrae TaxID=1639882 RepID=A0A841GZZ4_9BACT|nr:hypothetical protein [Longimicrobium terrae]MBB4637011.1 hypothetical protein [Longimicrobium terrae]MBB6071381.1 hypothetical protein [Longimicrobium terrae]NNC31402.1 hypothetical protein [Longimicrobium terrae]
MIHRPSPAALALLALLSGCFLPPDDSAPASGVSLHVDVKTQATPVSDSVEVQAVFYPAGRGKESIRFPDGTFRVQGAAAGRLASGSDGFIFKLPLDSTARTQGIRIQLPETGQEPLPVREFTLFSAARTGPYSMKLRAGRDLVLPAVPGRSGTLPEPIQEQWSAAVYRGGREITISGPGPLPSPLVVPWVLIPDSPADTMSIHVISTRQFVVLGTRPPSRMDVSTSALLEWNVRVVP